ncbi:MAG: 2OG-Fe(II) oxygenase [Bdellovibrionia bacterium]
MNLNSEQLQLFIEQGYVVVDDFLPEKQANQLSEQIDSLSELSALKPAAIGTRATHQANTSIRGDWTRWFDEKPTLECEISFTQSLEHLRQQFNAELYTGCRRFECHYALYPPSTGYQKHYDNFKGTNSRAITFVYYLNDQWQNSDGGHLLLYSPENPEMILSKIEPLWNRLLLFKSQDFPHEVSPTFKNRKSITGWMRTDE